MLELLEFFGILPFKIFRFLLSAVLSLMLAGFIYYQNSPSTKYILNLVVQVQSAKKISFDSCTSSPTSLCVQKILQQYQIADATTGVLVLVKLVSFFANQKSSGAQIIKTQQMHSSINQLLLTIDLKNNFLLKMKPFFSSAKEELCLLKNVEKKTTEKLFKKISDQSESDRQKAFDAYPNDKDIGSIFVKRKEILHRLSIDLEKAFPERILSKCENIDKI